MWSGRGVALVAAILTCACLAALLSWSVASPMPVSSAALGPDWQCSRVAFILTTCTRAVAAERRAIPVGVRAKEDCPPEL
ncbi:hypothetical protein IC762_17405 [Bradyrhizobium genosp. L]|nr:hypothetical protein IC762_17405 [Bradyrhizobium genosp. L]